MFSNICVGGFDWFIFLELEPDYLLTEQEHNIYSVGIVGLVTVA